MILCTYMYLDSLSDIQIQLLFKIQESSTCIGIHTDGQIIYWAAMIDIKKL